MNTDNRTLFNLLHCVQECCLDIYIYRLASSVSLDILILIDNLNNAKYQV